MKFQQFISAVRLDRVNIRTLETSKMPAPTTPIKPISQQRLDVLGKYAPKSGHPCAYTLFCEREKAALIAAQAQAPPTQ